MPKIIINSLAFIFFLAAPEIVDAQAILSDALALSGRPKYTAGFGAFDYVNPQAPKGGRVTLTAYGNFDNFNTFIFKGIAFAESADLSLESLG